MTKSKIKTLIMVVALVLVVALAAGLIVHFIGKDSTDKSVTDETSRYDLSGKVYDDNGNEMLSGGVYSMPRAMTISELEVDTVSQITISATVLPENATDSTVEWSIKFDNGSATDEYLTLDP